VWETFRTLSLFGAALLGQHKYGAADPHLVQSYQGLQMTEKSRGTRHFLATPRQDLFEALERLTHLYDAWNKPDQAAKWRKQLEAQGKAAGETVKPRTK
jgi:hypothetical protein